jgi:hypothetical protein
VLLILNTARLLVGDDELESGLTRFWALTLAPTCVLTESTSDVVMFCRGRLSGTIDRITFEKNLNILSVLKKVS